MLKIFRKHTKLIIWIVVGSFILWGGYSVSSLKKEGRYAGEAFGSPVTFQEYNRFYQATQLFMPSEKPLEDPELLRNYTWQNIVYAREAKREGVKVGDDEVRREIAGILKQQGLVDPTEEQYRIWLTRTLRISPREFEGGLREFMSIQKLLRMKIGSFKPAGTPTTTDPKANEALAAKQKTDFMAWTADVNQRARIKDYLALPATQEETTVPAPQAPVAPVAKPTAQAKDSK